MVLHLRFKQWLIKEDENELHQHNVGKDKEKRGQHDGVGGRAAHARGASARAHALKTCDQPDDQALDRGLECLRQKCIDVAP